MTDHTEHDRAIREAVEAERERCARLIELYAIQDTATGKRLVPRQDGNQDGLFYAAAIRQEPRP